MNSVLSLKENKFFAITLGILMGLMLFFMPSAITVKLIPTIFMAIIALYYPIYGLAAYILATPFMSHTKLLLFGGFIIFTYILKIIKEGSFRFKSSPINIFIFLFAFIVIANTVLSVDPAGSFRDFSIHMVSLGLMFILLHSKKTKKDIYLLSLVFVIASVLVSFHGIYQFLIDIEMESGWVDMSQNHYINTRVFSTFENPNLLAEYLLIIIPISIAFAFYSKDVYKKILFIMATGIMLLTIGLTYSRGGWLGLMVAIIVFLLLTSIKTLLLLIPIGALGILFSPASILQRIKTIGNLQDSSNFYRYNLWSMSLNILRDFWYSGLGIGYLPFFRKISPLYLGPIAPYHTHNTFLQVAVETGIVGLIIFAGLTLTLIKTAISVILQTKSKFIKIFTASYTAGLSGILLHGLVEHILYNPKIIITFWLIIGMITGLYRIHQENGQEGY